MAVEGFDSGGGESTDDNRRLFGCFGGFGSFSRGVGGKKKLIDCFYIK